MEKINRNKILSISRVTKDICLTTTHPEIAADWDNNKNDKLSPDIVTKGSHKKVWWKCKNNHSYQLAIFERTYNNKNCKLCNELDKLKENSLSIKFPTIAKEWDYEKNDKDLSPDKITCGSGNKIWWKCSENHSFELPVGDRTGTPKKNCNTCRMNNIFKENSISVKYPELAKEWDYGKNDVDISPDKITCGSNKKIWWMCSNNHSFELTPVKRTSRKQNCGLCLGDKSLEAKFPEIAKEWDYGKNGDKLPNNILAHSSKKYWFKCMNNHEYEAIISSRVGSNGCPTCIIDRHVPKYKPKQFKKEETFLFRFPEIAKEWHPTKNGDTTANDVKPASRQIGWWLCKNGHEYQRPLLKRVYDNKSCTTCKRNEKLKETSFENKHPELVKLWHPTKNNDTKPSSVSHGSTQIVWILCEIGHEYQQKVCEISQQLCYECKTGMKKQIIIQAASSKLTKKIKINDVTIKPIIIKESEKLIDKYPDIAKEWDHEKNKDLTISNITYKSSKKVWWKCLNGHEYCLAIVDRTIKNKECAECDNVNNINLLIKNYPKIAKEWDYEENDQFKSYRNAYNYDRKVWWVCNNGHKWTETTNKRLKSSECSECVMIKIRNENSLLNKFPEITGSWDYNKNKCEISKVSYKSPKKVWWLCSSGHSYERSIVNRTINDQCVACIENENKKIIEQNLKKSLEKIILKWDYAKNNNLSINDVSCNDKMWWLCDKNHSIYANVGMVRTGTSCSYCCNKKVNDDNCLANTFPDIAKQWHNAKNGDITPSDVVFGTQAKFWWKCKKNHIWKTSVNYRTRGSQCPKCTPSCYSLVAIKWFDQLMIEHKIFIQHAKNEGELRINLENNKYIKADGYCEQTNTIYEFHGCIFHGCIKDKCQYMKYYKKNNIDTNPITKKKFTELYDKTIEREKTITNLGYNLITIWECDYNNQIK
jgi:hypothetical protein